jgi:phosphonate transport system substrate-binding protein
MTDPPSTTSERTGWRSVRGTEPRSGRGPAQGAPAARDLDHLRFGSHLASNATAVGFHEFVTEEIGRRLRIRTELVIETSYESCIEDLDDVCFVCSLPYVTFERQFLDLAIPVAAPVLQGRRYQGRPIYFSDVIVHRDSDFQSFTDLRGASWAYNEPPSQSGYGITRYHLARLGETSGFFGRVVGAGFHREAIRMVADRQVDASAIDSHVLALEFREYPHLAREVRVVETLGPSTIQPVAVSRRVEATLREAIRDALVAMTDDDGVRERFDRALVDRFVAVDADAYDDIRRMVAFCESAGFLELR